MVLRYPSNVFLDIVSEFYLIKSREHQSTRITVPIGNDNRHAFLDVSFEPCDRVPSLGISPLGYPVEIRYLESGRGHRDR